MQITEKNPIKTQNKSKSWIVFVALYKLFKNTGNIKSALQFKMQMSLFFYNRRITNRLQEKQ